MNAPIQTTPRFRKQHFNYVDGVRQIIMRKEDMPDYSAEDIEQLYSVRLNRNTKTGVTMTHDERREKREAERKVAPVSAPPSWMKHDRQVLRFYGYFQEAVHIDATENARIRPLTLTYFLEDGTLKIFEPSVSNSGLVQGTFMKRHQVPHPQGGFFQPTHFKLGTSVTIYCRSFHVVDCDSFTKWYFDVSNLELGTPGKMPDDTFTRKIRDEQEQKAKGLPQSVAESKEYMELRCGAVRKNTKLRQHLDNDQKVLRFYAYWDDPTLYGSRNFFIVHYFLSDDTLEVRQQYERNQGCVPFPVFFSRNRVNRVLSVMPAPNMDNRPPEWVMPEDLILGQTFPLCGRDLFLYDCDEFTKEFYRKWLHMRQEPIPIQGAENCVPQSARTQPPIETSTPRADPCESVFQEVFEKGDKSLKFEATLINSKPEDTNRRFVVMFYVSDLSVAVFEKRQRNSGHVEGKFADRRKVFNPVSKKMYAPADFHVGATITVNSANFFLSRADEYTLALMEEHYEVFPYSDGALVAQKITDLKDDTELASLVSISPPRLGALIKRKLRGVLAEQELVTLLRMFPFADEGPHSGDIDVTRLREAMRDPMICDKLRVTDRTI